MVEDACEDVARIGFRIETVEIGGFDERQDRGGTLSPPFFDPAKNQFLRPSAIGRTARSAALLSISIPLTERSRSEPDS